MDDKLFREMDRALSEMRAEREEYESDWKEIAEFTSPGKAFDSQGPVEGRLRASRFTRLFDSTAIDSSHRLAASMGHLVTNRARPWAELGTDDPALDEDPLVYGFLQSTRDRVLTLLGMPEVGAYASLDEFYAELSDFGTAVMFLGGKANRLRPMTRPLAECWIAENEDGVVDRVIREWRIPSWRAADLFGAEAKQAKKNIEARKESAKVTIRHAVEPRAMARYRPGPVRAEEKPFASVYFEVESKSVLRVGGFGRMPYAVARIDKPAGSAYGRSPAFKHLGPIRAINAVARSGLRLAQKAADPPMLASDEGIIGNQLNTQAGGVTYFRRGMHKDHQPRPLHTGANPQVAEEQRRIIEAQIKRGFFTDLLELPMLDRMTATEVAQRQSSSLAVLNPMMERLESELLSPLVMAAVETLGRAGALPAVPAALSGRTLRVHYTGPLAMTRKAGRVVDTQRWITGIVSSLAQFNPDVLQGLDTDAILRSSARDLGVPASSLLPVEVVEAKRAQRAQAIQDEQQLAQIQGAAGALRDGAAASVDLGLTAPAGGRS